MKMNILELISILETFRSPTKGWRTIYKYGEETTPISIEPRDDGLLLNIPGYSKFFKFPESK